MQNNDEVETQLLELASQHKKYGYRKLHQKLSQKGSKIRNLNIVDLFIVVEQWKFMLIAILTSTKLLMF